MSDIEIELDLNGEEITVSPDEAPVSGPNPKVTWIDVSVYPEPAARRWEIRWKRRDGERDYFGAIDLVASGSAQARGEGLPEGESGWWTYSVTLVGTDENERRSVLATVDPRIRWDN